MSETVTTHGEYVDPAFKKVLFGQGTMACLPAEIAALGAGRAMIVTGKTLATQTDVIERAKSILGNTCASVFHGIEEHSPAERIIEGANQARHDGIDILVAIGGSSPADSAKAITMVLADGPASLHDLRVRVEPPDRLEIPSGTAPTIPIICVPTTLSSGEFTYIFGVTDRSKRVKHVYIDRRLTPRMVILDPETTVPTPRRLWASTGIQTLDHAVEMVYAKFHQPVCDALGLAAIKAVFTYLVPSVRNPENLEARLQMQIASWMSSYYMNTTLGIGHGLGLPMASLCGVPHGIAACLDLPTAMEYNRPVTADRQALMAPYMGIDTAGMSNEEASTAALERVRSLIRELELPQRLRDVGIHEADLEPLSEAVWRDPFTANNPRVPSSQGEILELLRRSF